MDCVPRPIILLIYLFQACPDYFSIIIDLCEYGGIYQLSYIQSGLENQ